MFYALGILFFLAIVLVPKHTIFAGGVIIVLALALGCLVLAYLAAYGLLYSLSGQGTVLAVIVIAMPLLLIGTTYYVVYKK